MRRYTPSVWFSVLRGGTAREHMAALNRSLDHFTCPRRVLEHWQWGLDWNCMKNKDGSKSLSLKTVTGTERESTNKQNLGTGWNKSGGFSCPSLAAGRWNRNQTTVCLCVFWVGDASCFNHNLTRQTVQLSSERGHDQVVLHDVRHLVLHVLLIECDQGIWAGIPNLNERLITPAVYKSILKRISVSYI